MALTSFQICSTQQSVANLTENNNNTKKYTHQYKNANIYLSGSISSAVAVAVFEHECVVFFPSLFERWDFVFIQENDSIQTQIQ